jgi:hypothetical protein
VTGNELAIEGTQDAELCLGNREFLHRFYVSSLPSEAQGILVTDFMKKTDAYLDLEKLEVRLKLLNRHKLLGIE